MYIEACMLYVFLGLAIIGLVTSSIFAGMVLMASLRYLHERKVALDVLREQPGFTPPLTLLKPLYGAEPGLEAYLVTFFEQNYPAYEILFCAHAEDDAGLQIARRVAKRYPHVPVKFLSTGGQPDYVNAKVASMERMEAAATHSILVISDSDVCVTPEYLRAIALPFAASQVGAVCCPYRGVAVDGGLWARLEAVGMSVEMTAGVLAARAMEGMRFALGPTMAFRRDSICRIGGFHVAANLCADDFVLGNEVFKLGQTVVLSHHPIDHMVINSSFISSLRHQDRWMKSTRFSRPKGHFGTALTFSLPFGFAAWALSTALGHPGLGLWFFAWSVATRLALSIVVGRLVVCDPNWFDLLLLYPLHDLMGFGLWVASYLGSRILWRGQAFQLLPGGKMQAAE
jgi:ceramide glucosyltransferase